MLIVVPPSETKRPPPDEGPPVDLDALSFPELGPLRRDVLEALMATSARPDAFERLRVGPSKAHEVARNTRLLDLPTRPASEVYTGPLHAGLDVGGMPASAARRAAKELVLTSALFGVLRPTDRIPSYRLHVCAQVAGLGDLEPLWRTRVPHVLAAAAGSDELVLDLRSPTYQAMGLPAGRATRTVTLRVEQGPAGYRGGAVTAKRVRGEAARHLLELGATPRDPDELADMLSVRWPARLEPPLGRNGSWTLTIRASS